MAPLPVPDAGVAVSQLPPLAVVAATVQLVADDVDGMVSCSVCDAGLTLVVAAKVTWDGVTVGDAAVDTLNTTGVCGGLAPETET